MTVRDNSRAEYWSAKVSGKITRQQAVILDDLANFGGTRAEIAKSTGIAINAVCGRVKELLDAGHVCEAPYTVECQVTGRNAHLVLLTGTDYATE